MAKTMSTRRPRAYPGYTTNRQQPSRTFLPRDTQIHPRRIAGLVGPRRNDYVLTRSTALLRMAIMLTGNRADTEDLLQAVLVKTYRSWGRINDRAALDAYVRRAMVNTHISWWRRRRVDEYPTDELPDQVVADHSRESDMAEVVRRALDRLPQRMRAAVQAAH